MARQAKVRIPLKVGYSVRQVEGVREPHGLIVAETPEADRIHKKQDDGNEEKDGSQHQRPRQGFASAGLHAFASAILLAVFIKNSNWVEPAQIEPFRQKHY